ncbi:MAG: DUF4197 family protein [Betaproteobacteria bacterium]|nr:DUF4197 family protein [Betaproteobacteria bacterium]
MLDGLAGISNTDATAGLREALTRGAGAAVAQLGVTDGFWSNPKVQIPLPGFLQDVAGLARMIGQGKRVDDLHLSMNRAAEAAVPQAKPLLVNAVRSMSVSDAKAILGGGDTSVTEFFKTKTEQPLYGRFLPVVTQTTNKVGLARQYNDFIDKVPVQGTQKIETYVTHKSLDGLYLVIGEQERKIRQDPVGTGSALLKKVFGAIR